MNVILYQLALVSRELAGSPGGEACACGPGHSLAEVVAARLTGPFVSKHAGGRKRRYGEGKDGEQTGGEGNEERKEKKRGAARVHAHLTQPRFVMTKVEGHRKCRG